MHPTPSAPAASRLRWWALSDRGKVRATNEDSFLGLRVDGREAHLLGKVGEAETALADFVFAVSDGIGGAQAGEFASRITVEKITRLLPRSYKQAAVGLEAGFGEVLAELFDQVHRQLNFYGHCYAECAGMGATLSLCWFHPGWVHFAHIGDSRIYYLSRGGELRQVSHDDTYVGWLYRNGKINEREARGHPRRNMLQRALGAGNQFVEPQLGSVNYQPGDRFILCSDGVVDGLYDRDISELVQQTGGETDPAQRLVREAVRKSGRDNTTAVVVEIV